MPEFIPSPNFWPGKNTHRKIVIHQWNDRAARPKVDGVVGWFQNPKSEVSAHWVISNDREIQMVRENDRAWHAMEANTFSIGIECDPNGGDAMYDRIIARCATICHEYGISYTDIEPHSRYVITECPKWIDLIRIRKGVKAKLENKGEDMVQDTKEDFLLAQRLFSQVTGRKEPLSKSEFDRQKFAGRSWKVVIDTFLRNGLARTQAQNAKLGADLNTERIATEIVDRVAGDLTKLIVGKK